MAMLLQQDKGITSQNEKMFPGGYIIFTTLASSLKPKAKHDMWHKIFHLQGPLETTKWPLSHRRKDFLLLLVPLQKV